MPKGKVLSVDEMRDREEEILMIVGASIQDEELSQKIQVLVKGYIASREICVMKDIDALIEAAKSFKMLKELVVEYKNQFKEGISDLKKEIREEIKKG